MAYFQVFFYFYINSNIQNIRKRKIKINALHKHKIKYSKFMKILLINNLINLIFNNKSSVIKKKKKLIK